MTVITSNAQIAEQDFDAAVTDRPYSGSRAASIEASPYVFSDPKENHWGQPSARHYFLTIHDTIMRGQLLGTSSKPTSALGRIQARQSEVVSRALELQDEYGDPVRGLAELLGSMPGNQEDWQALIDEPYY